MSRGLKLGIIGAGSMGKNHIRIAAGLSGTKLAGIADTNLSSAEEAANQYHSKPFADYRDLLPEVEAILLATPTSTHFQIAKEVLSAGKHLLVEKPFTGNPEQAAKLILLAKEKNLVLAVGFIENFNPAFQKLLKLLKGEKLHGIDIKRFSPYPARISDTNVIFDVMIHDLHLLSLLAGQEIESVKASAKKSKTKMFDQAAAVITFANGLIARVEANRDFGRKVRRLAVTTEKEMFDADLLEKRIYVRDLRSPIPSAVPVKPADQLTEEIANFILAIKGKSPLLSTAASALLAINLALEVEKACL